MNRQLTNSVCQCLLACSETYNFILSSILDSSAEIELQGKNQAFGGTNHSLKRDYLPSICDSNCEKLNKICIKKIKDVLIFLMTLTSIVSNISDILFKMCF